MNILPVGEHERPASRSDNRSVVVFLTPYRMDKLNFFRCVGCGKALFKYEYQLGMIADLPDYPGGNSVQIKCQRCGMMYRVVW